MKEMFEKLSNEILDSLDMSEKIKINCEEYREYYSSKSSLEHYRLLKYLSNNMNDSKIIDIGTLKGCSALALSSNKTNKIYSFNISNQSDLNQVPNNVELIIDDILNGKYDDLIKSSNLILLDTFHTGDFEDLFLKYIKNLNYSGALLLDDIKLNNEMISFWSSISDNKIDLTQFGHSTGTGIVFLNND